MVENKTGWTFLELNIINHNVDLRLINLKTPIRHTSKVFVPVSVFGKGLQTPKSSTLIFEKIMQCHRTGKTNQGLLFSISFKIVNYSFNVFVHNTNINFIMEFTTSDMTKTTSEAVGSTSLSKN